MDTTYILFFLVIFAVAVVLLKRGKRQLEPQSVFKQRDALFTAAERSLLGVLDQAAAGRYRVFGKVRVADVLTPAPKDKRVWQTLFNQIKAKHFDFVLCDPATLDVKAVLELNDSSHNSRRRAERDKFLRMACDNAGLPLIEVPAKRGYSLEAVRQLLVDSEAKLQGTDSRVDPTWSGQPTSM